MDKHVLPTTREKRFVYLWGIVHAILLLGAAKVLYFDGATLWEEVCAGLVLLFFIISAYNYAKTFRNGSAQAVMKATFPTLAVAYVAEAASLHQGGMSLAVLPSLLLVWLLFVNNPRLLEWLANKR